MMNLPPGLSFTPMAAPFSFGAKPEARTVEGTHRFSHWAMACAWGLWIAHPDFDYAAQAAQEVWDEVDRLENVLSRFIIFSDVYRLNAAAQRSEAEWISIGMDTWECLLLGLAVGEATGGAFDIGLAREIEARRDENDLIAQAAPQNWSGPHDKYLQLADEPPRARITNSQVQIDLGAIGKGFALDKAAQLLADWEIENVLLYAGQSTVLALGCAPVEMLNASASASTCSDDKDWPLELRDPQATDSEIAAKTGRVRLRNRALSGSGQALHGYHIIDPRNGRAASRNRATWAIAPSAALSDACSTAFMNMSAPEIEAFCASQSEVSALVWDGGWQSFGRDEWDLPE